MLAGRASRPASIPSPSVINMSSARSKEYNAREGGKEGVKTDTDKLSEGLILN
jgi:hypothetical protein